MCFTYKSFKIQLNLAHMFEIIIYYMGLVILDQLQRSATLYKLCDYITDRYDYTY